MTATIAHLTTVHQPQDARIFEKECRSLAAAGSRVFLIAPAEADKVVDGVNLRAIPIPISRRDRATRTRTEMWRAALDIDADVYHFHDPELIPIGLELRRRGKRVVYDVHEDAPKQILSKHWIPRSLRGLAGWSLGRLEGWAAARLNGVVAATPAIAARFRHAKTITVNNYPVVDPDQPLASASENEFRVTYVGGITRSRGLMDVLTAVAKLGARSATRFSLAGRFIPNSLEAEARAHPGWAWTDYHGWQSRGAITNLLAEAHAGLVPLHALPRFVESQPVKLFEYMAAGLPVVASDFPLWRAIVESSKCGLLVKAGDPSALADALAWLRDHPEESRLLGANGRRAVIERYNWRQEAEKLVRFYERVLNEDRHRGRRPSPIHQGGDRQPVDRRVA